VTIMREQRIDKHVPNLSGIPWPLRLFVDEEDLTLLQVQKAGARGTIMTVFSGLRKGSPRPEPRPRRGTKKSKRAKQEAAMTVTGAEDNGYTEKHPLHQAGHRQTRLEYQDYDGSPGPTHGASSRKGSICSCSSAFDRKRSFCFSRK